MDVYLATGNAHKLAEFREIFETCGVRARVCGASDLGGMPDVAETAETFSGNAFIKASALRAAAPAAAWVFADDSGLEVDALGGAPGVRSARYAGAHGDDGANTQKLLRALDGVPAEKRGAQFACHLCLISPEAERFDFAGVCRGRIAFSPAGCGGFGYDPVFVPDGFDRSFAELGEAAKNALSHRGKAARALAEFLKARGV